jgi:hypothetical protein
MKHLHKADRTSQAIMKEAMRCHPGVEFPLERVVPDGGATLCNIRFEKGTIVGINAAVMHRDTTIFGDDAGAFRPERWTESSDERIKLMDRHLMTVSLFFPGFERIQTDDHSSGMDLALVLGRISPLWRWVNWFRRFFGTLSLSGLLRSLSGMCGRSFLLSSMG